MLDGFQVQASWSWGWRHMDIQLMAGQREDLVALWSAPPKRLTAVKSCPAVEVLFSLLPPARMQEVGNQTCHPEGISQELRGFPQEGAWSGTDLADSGWLSAYCSCKSGSFRERTNPNDPQQAGAWSLVSLWGARHPFPALSQVSSFNCMDIPAASDGLWETSNIADCWDLIWWPAHREVATQFVQQVPPLFQSTWKSVRKLLSNATGFVSHLVAHLCKCCLLWYFCLSQNLFLFAVWCVGSEFVELPPRTRTLRNL